MLPTGSPGREDDPNGVYTAAGSPVASFPSIYSETDQSSRASQTYSQGQTSLMRCAARLLASAARLSMRERPTPHCLILYLGACRRRRTVEEHLSDAGAEGTTFHILAKRMDPSRSRLAASRAFHDLLCTIHSLPCAERLSSQKQAEVRERLWVLTACGGWVRADMASHGQVQVQQKIAYGDIRMRLVSAAA